MIDISEGSRHRLLAPRVVFLIGTRGADGPNVAPISNVMQMSWSPALVAVAVWKEWTTHRNLIGGLGFSISVPREENSELIWRLGHRYSGFVIPNGSSKLEAAGGEWNHGFSRFGPVLVGAVGWLSCELVSVLDVCNADHTLFLGRILSASGDPSFIDSDGQYLRNPGVIAQVTGNQFSVSGEFFRMP